jgi:preprotein translocase subunit SecD
LPERSLSLRGPDRRSRYLRLVCAPPTFAIDNRLQPSGGRRAAGKVTQKSPNSYFVLNDNPVLTGADIQNPQQDFDERGGGTGAPNVTFGFTGHRKSVFQNVTLAETPVSVSRL